MEIFDRTKLEVLTLAQRESKSSIQEIALDPEAEPPSFQGDYEVIERIADAILQAREHSRAIIIAYGAHLIKNGLGTLLRRMIDRGFVTHLATNGAGSIHDWEFAFQGRSEEDVRKYAQEGQFGIWDETGRYINLALLIGSASGKGYGESIGELIHTDKLVIPTPEAIKSKLKLGLSQLINSSPLTEDLAGLADLLTTIETLGQKCGIKTGEIKVEHPFKKYSVQDAAYAYEVPITVHPGIGYDIIYTHPLNHCAAIGRVAGRDFLSYVASVSDLEGGVYLSIGSAIMSPMIFEKSLSMARNVARQEGRQIKDFLLVVNDIQPGEWQWGTGIEPGKDDPAYYLRFCKTFDRMGAREMRYVNADNRAFLLNLYHALNDRSR